jgi:hypothetical protein
MKTLPFSYEGRSLEARMVSTDGAFVFHVWEGLKQVSSVPFVVSKTEAQAADGSSELEQALFDSLIKVRDTVLSGGLVVI